MPRPTPFKMYGRWIAGCATFIALLLAITACSSGASTSSKGGGSKPASINGPKQLKIAYFPGGTSTTYLTAENDATMNTAKAAGASIKLFDPAFDATTQFNQMQNALSSGNYNAVILTAISGQVMCPLVKQAIGKGIAVVTGVDPVCGLDTKSGDAIWYKGTVQAVTSTEPAFWDAFYNYVKKENPSGGETANFNGPQILPLTKNSNNAAKKAFAGSNITIVGSPAGDYSTPTALTMAQNIFKAHPNIRIVTSTYSAMTIGIVAAAKQAGILNKIRVYDAGGSKEALNMVANGTIRMTADLAPANNGKLCAQALIRYAGGKTLPHTVSGDLPIKIITKANLAANRSGAY